MTIVEDSRCCASLFARFETSLTSTTRTTTSIEGALINLAFLKVRVERFNPTSQQEINTVNMLNANIDNAIAKGQEILSELKGRMTAQEEIIDLMGDTEFTHHSTEQFDIDPLFASLNLNTATDRNRNSNNNAFSRPKVGQNQNFGNTFNTQSQFNQNVPLSSTNAYTNRNTFGAPLAFDPNVQPHNLNLDANGNNFNNFSVYPPFKTNLQPDFNSIPHESQNQIDFTRTPQRYDHKLYKWKVKFTGENTNFDAIDFIQKVNALAQSRGVSDRDLFESAIDLFSGQALKWYYGQRNQTKSWAELSEKLISDFIEVNYYDNLLDTIRQRKQTSDESIVHFFTIFEDNCFRLQNPMSTNEKIHILKKNILHKYRPYVTLKEYKSINDLKHDLKLLEASMVSTKDRNVSFNGKTNTHTSRYDSFRGNRSYSRSPSNSSNAARPNRSGTPIPNDKNRNTSYDRSENRNTSPYENKKRNESFDRNKNSKRSDSRDSNASQRYKSPKNLNR